MFIDPAKSRSLGRSGEARVARFFRAAGFEAVLSLKSRGAFDVCATRADRTVVVQVKNYTGRQNASRRPYVLLPALLAAPAPEGALRVWWARCANTGQEFIWHITPTGFVPLTREDLI